MLELEQLLRDKVSPENWAAVQSYKEALPCYEYVALVAWLTTFYPFQLEWMLEQASYAACNKSRQIGLSHTTGGWGVILGAFHGELTTIISVGELESKEVLDKVKKHQALLTAFGSRLARPKGRGSATQVEFSSGGRVLALPSTGGRSFTGNVFLDEFAYQQNQSEVWDAAMGVTMHAGYKARIASTPNGVGDMFDTLINRTPTELDWRIHQIDIHRAIAEGMPVDLRKCQAMSLGDKRIFSQLFECAFLDGVLQYLPSDAIYKSLVPADGLRTWDGEFYAGMDIGKTIDRTVLVILRRTFSGHSAVQAVWTCKRTDMDKIQEFVELAVNRFGVQKICIDSTGLGAHPTEEMQKRYGKARVEAYNFTLQTKEVLATTLFSVFTSGNIRLPADDEALPRLGPEFPSLEAGISKRLVQDLCSIKRQVTSSGNVRYDASHTKEGHADSAWALALALYAAGQSPTKVERFNG